MKPAAKLASLAALLCLFTRSAAFVVIDDNSELFVTGAVTIQSDDNIYQDATSETDDTIISFIPGLELVYGKNAATSGKVYYREEIRRYSDNGNQDVELANVGANAAYDNGVTKADLNASFAEIAQNTSDANLVGSIARRDVTSLGGDAEFGFLQKTKLGVGLNYVKTDYKPAGFSDSTITTLPVDVYYAATEKLDWSFGYQYRQSNLSGTGTDSDDSFFNLGARGEFTPKLNGQVRVGYNQRSFDAGGDEDLFGFGANLSYKYSDKTSLQLTLDNDFGSAGTGDSTKNLSWGVNGSTQLTDQWFVNASLSLRKIDYPTRTDDYTEGLLGVAYKYNQWVDFSGSFTFRDNSSDLAGAEFANTVFSLGANIRY